MITVPEAAPARAAPEPATLHGLHLLAHYGSELVCEIDARQHLVWISPSVARLTGLTAPALQGRPLADLIHINDRNRLATLLAQGEAANAQDSLRLLRPDSNPVWVECRVEPITAPAPIDPIVQGEPGAPAPATRRVCVLRDITEHRQIEDGLARLARTDTLTGLPNRLRLTERIDASILRASRQDHGFALAMFDLDHFKYVNDTLGHDAGDELLCAVGARLADVLRDTDVLARWGGDEFVLLFGRESNAAVAQHRIEACIAALGAPFLVRGRVVHIGASAGIAMYPEDGTNQTELMRNADLAMYRAKSHGPSTVVRFSADLAERARQRLSIENDLHAALAATAAGHSPFALRYQPIIDSDGLAMSGVEALVRWFKSEPDERSTQDAPDAAARPATMRMIGPDLFIPIAEESGLIVPLGSWVLDEACRFRRSLSDAGQVDDDFYVSVNVSARQFQSGDFAELIRGALARHGLAAHQLQIEVTESAIMHNPERAAATMQAIRALGVPIAIDDFGTGFSSLAYLARFPANGLKIDKSFVRAMDSGAGMAIVEATVAIANALNMKVTAEGVETAAQRDALVECGSQRLQGYLFDKPLTSDELLQRLAKN